MKKIPVELIQPKTFQPEKHWYPKVLNAQIHPLVQYFMNMSIEQIMKRYCHLHPGVDQQKLSEVLRYIPTYFHWSGADLMSTVNADGLHQMVVVETNSCPSGQKSFPLRDDLNEQGGYRDLVEKTIAPKFKKKSQGLGVLAVIYDKNPMENTGYAAVIADVMKEPVYCVEFPDGASQPHVRVADEWLEILTPEAEWVRVRAAFRYVTQRPWNRLPLFSKTTIINPIICCLAGGRNKLIAAKAYNLFNAELAGTGLSIVTPKTIWDVNKNEIKLWVRQFGMKAVIKVPYSNAGQGVFTIVNERELEEFLALDHPYEKFIVQSLIGNYNWSSANETGRLYQTGTIPTADGTSFVFDLRMMIGSTVDGLRPVATYSRRAATPLEENLTTGLDSKTMLMTNLSYHTPSGEWETDESRLILMDRKDFNKLGVSVDDLVDGYIQTVLATIAIDKMSRNLITTKKTFKQRLFRSLNDDEILIREIL